MTIFRLPEFRASAGIRIHKSDAFVREFYEVRWPRIRFICAVSVVLFLIILTWNLFIK